MQDEELKRKLSIKVKDIRANQRLTISQFAELCEISERAVSYIEHGANAPSIRTLYKINQKFGISIDSFFTEFDSTACPSIPTFTDGQA